MVLQMNQNRLDKYSKTNEKIVPWTLFIIFLISIPILYILSIEKVRFNITNDFNSNKTIICKVHDIKIEVSKADGWIIDDSYKFVKGPTRLHTPEQFGQPADLHPDTLPELIRTASRFIFGQF